MVTERVELHGPACDEERKSYWWPAVVLQEGIHKSKALESHNVQILLHGVFIVELVWGLGIVSIESFLICSTVDQGVVTYVEVVAATY